MSPVTYPERPETVAPIPGWPATPSIPSAKGPRSIALSSLRPGAWLHGTVDQFGHEQGTCVVLQNSATIRRMEVYYPAMRTREVLDYAELSGCVFHGHGTRRWWRRWLPRWLRWRVSPFGQG